MRVTDNQTPWGGAGTIQMVPWHSGFVPAEEEEEFETGLALSSRQSRSRRSDSMEEAFTPYTTDRRLSPPTGRDIGSFIDVYA